jgi:hypothetical protein
MVVDKSGKPVGVIYNVVGSIAITVRKVFVVI